MATGISNYLANKLLDAVFNATAFSVAQPWIKLHVGDPGAAGTSNPATETTRKSLSTAAAASAAVTSDAALQWTGVSGAEDYTHWSAWDASSGGNFLESGTITANAVLAGDTFTIPVGDFDVTVPVAS